MFTTSIVFDHRNRTEKGKEGPLEIRVTINRKSHYINTGVRVTRAQWKYDTIINRPDSNELNERLTIVLKKVESCINDSLRDDSHFDIEKVRDVVKASLNQSKRRDFLEWCYEQLPVLQISEGTLKHYHTMMCQLEKFANINNWSDLTVEKIMAFDVYLHSLTVPQSKFSKDPPKKISDAAVYTYHKCLKALIHRAVDFGKINANPYERLKGKFKKGTKENIEYLTEDEMKRIEELDLQDGTIMKVSRDLFVFQMYTGMAYTDAMAFDISKYKKVDGKWIARSERIKTGVAFVSQLLPPVVKVLEQYDMKVPQIDNSDYNEALKTIGQLANIETRMHSHLARHTFATFMLRNGVKMENLAKMMGHTTITQTQRYAKVLAMSVHEEFDNISKRWK